MMIRGRLWLTLAIFALIAGACDSPPSDWQGQRSMFDFTGTVTLYDQYRNRLKGTADVVIELKRASKSTTADSLGNWRLNEIPFGVRDTLVFTREGYDPVEIDYYPTEYSGPSHVYLSMFPSPTHQVSLLSARLHPDGERIEVVGLATKREFGGPRSVAIFAGKSQGISSALDHHDYMTSTKSDATEETFVAYITPKYWPSTKGKISSGDRIYIMAYPTADFQSNIPLYANGYMGLGKTGSNVVTFVMP